MIASIKPVLRLWTRFYFGKALEQISRNNPMHPDIPRLVIRVNELNRPTPRKRLGVAP